MKQYRVTFLVSEDEALIYGLTTAQAVRDHIEEHSSYDTCTFLWNPQVEEEHISDE